MAANFCIDETKSINQNQEKITPLSKLLSRCKLGNSESKATMSSIGSKYTGSTRLGDQCPAAVDFKTDTLFEDHAISRSILGFDGGGVSRSFSKTSTNKNQPGNLESPIVSKKKLDSVKIKKKDKKASPSPSLGGILPFLSTDEMSSVTAQLKLIQETQDSILESLRNDIDLIQTENLILRQNNGRLQSQVSQMNQLVADLSFDLRQMRDIISARQALGIPLSLVDKTDNKRNVAERDKTIRNKVRHNLNEEETERIQSPAHLYLAPPSNITRGQRPYKGKLVEEMEERRLKSESYNKSKRHSKMKNVIDASSIDTTSSRGVEGKTRKYKNKGKEMNIEVPSKSNEKHKSCFGGLFKGKKSKRKTDSDQE